MEEGGFKIGDKVWFKSRCYPLRIRHGVVSAVYTVRGRHYYDLRCERWTHLDDRYECLVKETDMSGDRSWLERSMGKAGKMAAYPQAASGHMSQRREVSPAFSDLRFRDHVVVTDMECRYDRTEREACVTFPNGYTLCVRSRWRKETYDGDTVTLYTASIRSAVNDGKTRLRNGEEYLYLTEREVTDIMRRLQKIRID